MSDIFIDIRGLIGTSKPRFHDSFDEEREKGRRRREAALSFVSLEDRGSKVAFRILFVLSNDSSPSRDEGGKGVKRGRNGNENENSWRYISSVSFRFARRNDVVSNIETMQFRILIYSVADTRTISWPIDFFP